MIAEQCGYNGDTTSYSESSIKRVRRGARALEAMISQKDLWIHFSVPAELQCEGLRLDNLTSFYVKKGERGVIQ